MFNTYFVIAMKKNVEIGKFGKWTLPVGVFFGIGVIFCVIHFDLAKSQDIAFILLFFPMLLMLFVLAAGEIVFWVATGMSTRGVAFKAMASDELLRRIEQSGNHFWLIGFYNFLQAIVMFGGGYISIAPVIGFLILK